MIISVLIYVASATFLIFYVGRYAMDEKCNRWGRGILAILFSLVLAVLTAAKVCEWTRGVLGYPEEFDTDAYYRVIVIGTTDNSGDTPVLLKRPDDSVRAIRFNGLNSANDISNGTPCKIRSIEIDGKKKWTLEALR